MSDTLLLAPEPKTAPAAVRPCQLYAHSGYPKPTRTQGHHPHPIYLQMRVYGEIRDKELKWFCGLCHDSVHDWISFLLGEARKPDPEPGYRAKAEAQAAYDWYQEMLRLNDAA